MGRRALRRVDPSLDLTEHTIASDRLPEQLTSSQVFHNALPLELEVGSGKGLFLTTASASCPEHNFLGIEVSRKYARLAAARLARAGLANAKVIQVEAAELFRDRIPADSVHAVHIYFPDPWWKKRHKKRRLMKEPFLRDVEKVLVRGGRLHFWTDVQEYYDTSLDLISRVTSLEGPSLVSEKPAEHDLDYRTHFERRMRLSNAPVYRGEFRKPDSPGPVRTAPAANTSP